MTWNCEIENVRGAYQKKLDALLSTGDHPVVSVAKKKRK